MVAGTASYLAVTVALLSPTKLVESISRRAPIYSSANGGFSWEFFNPEVDQLVSELKQQKEMLTTREQQLNELATRLQAERAEIDQVTQGIVRLQEDLNRVILRIRDEETANLKKLAKVYAGMSPDGAAAIFRHMDDDQVVKILVFMKEGEAAPIIETMARISEAEAKRAATLSQRLKTAVFRNTP